MGNIHREPEGEVALDASMPGRDRIWLSAVFMAITVGVAAVIYVCLKQCAAAHVLVKPSELGLGNLMTLCMGMVAFLIVPWNRLGVRVKSLWGLEFENAMNQQRDQATSEFALLKERVAALEKNPNQALGEAKARQKLEQEALSDPLVPLIDRFLAKHRGWYFNAARIRNWGSQQGDFSGLKQPTDQIEGALKRMLEAGKVKTKISERGSTLYGAK